MERYKDAIIMHPFPATVNYQPIWTKTNEVNIFNNYKTESMFVWR